MAGSPPRPLRGRARRHRLPACGARRTPTGYPRGDRSSYTLAHSRREHAELIAILGHGASRDLHATLLQDVHDGLIGERVLRIFLRHELLDLRLDAARRDVLAGGGGQTGGEEELEW